MCLQLNIIYLNIIKKLNKSDLVYLWGRNKNDVLCSSRLHRLTLAHIEFARFLLSIITSMACSLVSLVPFFSYTLASLGLFTIINHAFRKIWKLTNCRCFTYESNTPQFPLSYKCHYLSFNSHYCLNCWSFTQHRLVQLVSCLSLS